MAKKMQSKAKVNKHPTKNANRGMMRKDLLYSGREEEDHPIEIQIVQLEELFNQTMRDLDAFHLPPPVDTSIFTYPGKQNYPSNLKQKLAEARGKKSELELLSISSNGPHAGKVKQFTSRERNMDVPAFHMNAASNSSEGIISDSSKNTLTSLALPKVCAFSSAKKAECELSLPKINNAPSTHKIESEISPAAPLKLPKFQNSHEDLWNSSTQKAEGMFQSMEKWLDDYNCSSQSTSQLSKHKFRQLDRNTSMANFQSTSRLMQPTEDMKALLSLETPRMPLKKSHSTVWMLAKTLQRLNRETRSQIPQPLTHCDVARLLADKTAEKIRTVVPRNKKGTIKENCGYREGKHVKCRPAEEKKWFENGRHIPSTSTNLETNSLSAEIESVKSSMRSGMNPSYVATNHVKQNSTDTTPKASRTDGSDLYNVAGLPSFGASKLGSFKPGSSLLQAKGLSSAAPARSESTNTDELRSKSGKQFKNRTGNSLPAHLQTPLWWREL